MVSLDDLVHRMWLEQRDAALELAEQLVLLADAVDPPAQVVEQGYLAAHRLAGSLGMYGMPDGSELASVLEESLTPGDEGVLDHDTFQAIATQLRSVILLGPTASNS
jgi:chemotaxis protein histidine kinase CheA